jgi:hypothetical protein
MISKIRALGLAFVAVTAMSAMAASAAHAGTAHIGTNPAALTAHSETGQQHILSITGAGIFNSVCDTATIQGQVGEGSGTQTVHEATVTPTYSSCKLAGTNATVRTNGCQYTLTGAGEGANTFSVDVVKCTTGKSIQIQTALCVVDVPAQNGLSHVVGTNLGGEPNKEVTLNATVTGITAQQTGAACPGGNNATTNTASFSGATIAKAFVDGGDKTVTLHGHQYNEEILGEQVELIST